MSVVMIHYGTGLDFYQGSTSANAEPKLFPDNNRTVQFKTNILSISEIWVFSLPFIRYQSL